MCLCPITIYNPKNKLTLQGGTSFLMTVPCGKCAECQKVMSDAWFFRAYYQSKDCIDNDGYIYFDTLTYRNEDLPHISDFFPVLKGRISDVSCFNLDHYRQFFKKLRVYLQRAGYGTKNLKYFLSSEYGTDERYTHRPHYHILFYVYRDDNGKLIPVEEFSELVRKAWIYGRTDGIYYKGMKYVLDHTFGKSYNNDVAHIQSICNYVSKYVMKDSEFEQTIKSRINVIAYNLFGKKKFEDLTFEEKDIINAVARDLRQFHRQSQGFGLSFMNYNDYDEMFESGMIKIPSTDATKPCRQIPIPRYFQEHLFYTKEAGNRNRQITDEGIKFKMNRMAENVWRFHDRINDWLLSQATEGREEYLQFLTLNDERDLYEFAKYVILYKGKIKSWKMRWTSNIAKQANCFPFCGNEDMLDDFVANGFRDDDSYGVFNNYSHAIYKRDFGNTKFVTREDLGNRVDGYADNKVLNDWFDELQDFTSANGYVPDFYFNNRYKFKNELETVGKFCEEYVISDMDDYNWFDYDKMYDIYMSTVRSQADAKQNLFDWQQHLKKELKARGLMK